MDGTFLKPHILFQMEVCLTVLLYMVEFLSMFQYQRFYCSGQGMAQSHDQDNKESDEARI
jgi:hypothetical protein